LIASPIVSPSSRSTGLAKKRVWLPVGTWFNFFTGESLTGVRWHTIHAALEDIPVFAKAGGIVPLSPLTGWGGVGNPEELDLYIFPGADNRFELYEDDGETTSYQHNEYALTPFTLEQAGNTLIFPTYPVMGDKTQVPARRTYRIHLRGVDASASCPHPSTYQPAVHTLSLEPITLKPDDIFVVQFKFST
jgi:alpha-glucosidase (family GH31 glycosyl hydrolase)